LAALGAAVLLGGVLAACGGGGAKSPVGPPRGGELTVSLGEAEWPSLDPATDVLAARNAPILDAVYGGLFELGPNDAIQDDLATGYRFSNAGRTLSITLRAGVHFQDGSPFTSADVTASIERDLLPKNACICASSFAPVTSVAADGDDRVVIGLSRPDSALVDAFIGEAPNWVVSTAALDKEGPHLFSELPIGAGPFEVVRNVPSGAVTLDAYARYWAARHPYLSKLVFDSVSSDSAAVEAPETLRSAVALGVTTPSVLEAAMKVSADVVTALPGQSFQYAALNERVAPFDDEVARKALAEATDPTTLNATLYGGLEQMIEEPDGPGDAFFVHQVPGYVGYDPSAARKLVRQLGGLSFTLESSTDTNAARAEVALLSAQWKAVGMTVHVQIATLAEMVADTEDGSWQCIDATWGGSVDPAVNLPVVFSSTGPYSGTDDPVLDADLLRASTAITASGRRSAVLGAYARIATQVHAVPLYSAPSFVVESSNVHGLSSSGAVPLWEDIYL